MAWGLSLCLRVRLVKELYLGSWILLLPGICTVKHVARWRTVPELVWVYLASAAPRLVLNACKTSC